MKNLYKLFLAVVGLGLYNIAFSQCAPKPIVNNDTLCFGDSTILPVTNLPGVYNWYNQIGGNIIYTGDTLHFNGTSTDTFYVQNVDTGGFGPNVYYIRSQVGEPWGQQGNVNSMNDIFGPGNWNMDFFETVNLNNILSPSTCLIFMDGSDNGACAFGTFLTNNLTQLEAWVNAGGRLILNSAPNQCSNINFGFGGTTLNYNNGQGNVTGYQPAHPIFNSPYTTGINFTGSSFSHSHITGSGLDTLITGTNNNYVVLATKPWGGGLVMFGGMTTPNFHNPQPNANNLRSNIIDFMKLCGFSCVSDFDTVVVVVNPLPNVTYTQNPDTVCLQAPSLLLNGASPNGGIYSGNGTLTGGNNYYFAANLADLGMHNITYTYTDANGCVNSATASIYVYDCVGINEFLLENIKVYPNPMSEVVNIDFGKTLESASLQIIAADGKMVLNKIIHNTSTETINTSNYHSGIYLIKVSYNTEEYKFRIIKN
ncbi:hypothetical protein FLAV_00172 [Flavobacteriales bacterium]|nr:hypothetical protein FLAV_00172 [Flavobacteriales bacterium]